MNKRQKLYFAQKIVDFFQGADLSKITIAIWGLTFKPKTDDVRESPAIDIINVLLSHGISVKAFDPEGKDNAHKILGDRIIYAHDHYSALEGADALAIVTEWNMFKSPDIQRMKELLKRPVIFDGRNILYPPDMHSHGFTYFGIGRS